CALPILTAYARPHRGREHLSQNRSPVMPRRRNRALTVLIRVLALGTAALVLLVAGIGALAWNVTTVDTVGEVDFDTELVIPPLRTEERRVGKECSSRRSAYSTQRSCQQHQ